MRRDRILTIFTLSAAIAGGEAVAARAKLDPADTAAAYKAAGMTQNAKGWSVCPKGGRGGSVEIADDLNGDGQPDALIVAAAGRSSCRVPATSRSAATRPAGPTC